MLYLNPDGHEWKRDKWPLLVKKYWKYSEGKMVKQSDLIVCDSKNIESYINQEYGKKCPLKTTFIAYGSDMTKSNLRDDDRMVKKWFSDHSVISGEYYLIVGRFVPENSYEIIIREFLKTDTRKSLIIIANQNEKLYSKILKKTNFTIDERIKFVGTVYNQELLKKIRENAYGYIHGHTVGGTNPSLIESLSSTNINLLRDVTFNREVAKDTALYWDDSDNSLCRLIDEVDTWSQEKRIEFGDKAKKRVSENYTWKIICDKYEELFIRKK